ncbi:MAG: signal peptidase I [Clostridia bacterium]|nr:signal peptidase I [Clostridia bacterium]NCC75325.1 signal peptidase I [Clostridia bacterium]
MRRLDRVIDAFLMILAALILAAAIASSVGNKPFLFTAVRSNSMYPVLERGDLVLIQNLAPDEPVLMGDLVIFRAKSGELASQGYIVHRITGGDSESGFETKGDGNTYSDQEAGNPKIDRAWVSSRVLVWQGKPAHVPLLGFFPVWLERLELNRMILPVIAFALALIVVTGEFRKPRRKARKKKAALARPLVFVTSGLTLSILMAATMMAASERVTYLYEVTADQRGAMLGSSAGILLVGDELDQPLADLENNGFLPVLVTIVSDDDQLSFSHPLQVLGRGSHINTKVHLLAQAPGIYHSKIQIGLFYQLLPSILIYQLARISYWLALSVVALIPGLPLLLFPWLDRTMRHTVVRVLRKKTRQVLRL